VPYLIKIAQLYIGVVKDGRPLIELSHLLQTFLRPFLVNINTIPLDKLLCFIFSFYLFVCFEVLLIFIIDPD
jgi:hypothetical protein